MRRTAEFLRVPSRGQVIWVLGAIVLLIGTALRLALALLDNDASLINPLRLFPVMGLGLVYDTAAAMWWLLPLAVMAWLWPAGKRADQLFSRAALGLASLLLAAQVTVGATELVFWNEFATRFNFIAVDYLIYSREVLGNIRESYNLPLLLGALGTVVLAVLALCAGPLLRAAAAPAFGWRARGAGFAAYLTALGLITVGVDTQWKEVLGRPQLVQLAGNGTWEFFHAFRYNEIDYQRFYRIMPQTDADALARREFADRTHYWLTGSTEMPIERQVLPLGKTRDLNVVMVSIESFGAEFIESLGGKPGLAPNFERLGREGLSFTHLYATGTRTVRGLEALTLSVPPTPGHAIPMRPRNSGLFTIGGVLKDRGYEPLYIYGGYSQFDNMNAFFGGNGYTVIDRTAIDKKDISYENIWGVADEDLFRLAIREMDTRASQGKKFFAHVMTTSNHRPFTYPSGRIDIPSGTSRDGAVKYTDYAIGRFVEEARGKPWFANTLFVFVADHTSIARGRSDLSLDRYHIPMVIYAPGLIAPGIVDTMASQIDVAPTILGWMNLPYVSQFFGRDILRDGPTDPRIFMANYQTVGLVDDGLLVELRPRQSVRVMHADTQAAVTGAKADEAANKAIALYQVAAKRFSGKREADREDGMKRPSSLISYALP